MALIPPFMLDAVVAIGFRNSDPGNVDFAGTGFVYGHRVGNGPTADSGEYQMFIITNRHVLQGKRRAILRFNPIESAPAKLLDADLLDTTNIPLWFAHPDPDIDVGVLPVNAATLKAQGIKFEALLRDKHVLAHADPESSNLCEGDGVFVLGYPMGNVGNERNYVVVRQGCLARIRESRAGAAKQFLIDATVFPGNSGGPVILRPEITSIQGTSSVPNASLIGVVSAYLTYRDIAISQQTQHARITFEENSGLASVVPIDRVNEVVDLAIAGLSAR